ncbi:MAG: signal peptide peptidase SppA [candidate division Zixibacteria bacterium]|nr:signal peptide peptidase SppA [candidate division Zixibacteria bacterium]
MARTRDVVVGVIIVVTSLVVLGFFGVAMMGVLSGTGEMDLGGFGSSVGVVEMYGVMTEASGRPVIGTLERWQDNNSIKAVVVHVDSPGGQVAISQEIYDAILRLREEKPVVVSMASVAASGGYYIACAADRVMANPGTLTGSIGVIMSFHTVEQLLDKVGIATETIKSGELKDVGSYSRKMSRKEELMLQAVVSDTYEQFVGVVAEGRGLEVDEVYPLADGSIFTGMQAYNLGLVDTLGGLYDAIELAADLAEIGGTPKVVRPFKRESVSIFDLMGTALGQFSQEVKSLRSGPQLLYLYR